MNKAFLAAAVLSALSTFAWTTPSGLNNIPTADTVPMA